MRKPIILRLPTGEATEIVRKNDCGIIVNPENNDDFKNAIVKYANDEALRINHGKNGREMVEKYFNREKLAKIMLNELFNKIEIQERFK